MYFKKLICALSLASCGYALADQVSDKHEQNIARIVEIFDKALCVELASIDSQVSENRVAIDITGVETKFAYAFKNELTPEQQTLVLNVLKNLKAISLTTIDDLMLMAKVQTCDVDEKALKKYAPEVWRKMEMNQSREMSDADRLALYRELEKVDFGSVAATTLIRFMCKSSYLEDLDAMVNVNVSNKQLLFQKYLYPVVRAIALPCVVLNDSYFFPGWEEKFEESAKVFYGVHNISIMLLKEIEA